MKRTKKPVMMEFHTVKKIDNTRIVRHVEPVKMRNLVKTAVLGAIVAVCCMLYAYQHFHCIDLSFQLEDLKAKKQAAQGYNGELKLEIATLRDPRRIDVIARHQLGLTQTAPGQMREYTSLDGAQVAARYVAANRVP
jgi:cell division protein FtsL